MPEHILEKLFDSAAKVRLLKLFLRNQGEAFSMRDIVARTQMNQSTIRKPLEQLHEIGCLRTFTRRAPVAKVKNSKKGGAKLSHKKSPVLREHVFILNPYFVFYDEIRNLIFKSSPASKNWMAERLKKIGQVKLAVLSGLFVRAERENMHTDLLVIGDDMSTKRMENFIRALEAEVGTRLNYTVLSSEEYAYRMKMFDRFALDIMEGPHEKIINKLKA